MSMTTSQKLILETAKELTLKAIEVKMITASANAEMSAKNVSDFFNKLVDTLKYSED